jgi:hypothetical protein
MTSEYTYRFRVYPNKKCQHLSRRFGCAHDVYNWRKEFRTNAYGGEGLPYN